MDNRQLPTPNPNTTPQGQPPVGMGYGAYTQGTVPPPNPPPYQGRPQNPSLGKKLGNVSLALGLASVALFGLACIALVNMDRNNPAMFGLWSALRQIGGLTFPCSLGAIVVGIVGVVKRKKNGRAKLGIVLGALPPLLGTAAVVFFFVVMGMLVSVW